MNTLSPAALRAADSIFGALHHISLTREQIAECIDAEFATERAESNSIKGYREILRTANDSLQLAIAERTELCEALRQTVLCLAGYADAQETSARITIVKEVMSTTRATLAKYSETIPK